MMRWSELHGDMQRSTRERATRRACSGAVISQVVHARSLASNRSKRNSLSGKFDLPCRPARGGLGPAHIGEALLPVAVGNPEGSPGS